MIVCLDTSGSMTGVPERVAHSTLIRLLAIADRQKRDCFLIAFSVSIQPIDVRKERANLLSFFSRTACGDTDASRMMKKTFELLQSGKTTRMLMYSGSAISAYRFRLPPFCISYRKLGRTVHASTDCKQALPKTNGNPTSTVSGG